MNNPFKIREIRKFLVSQKVEVYALLETKIRSHVVGKIQKKFGKDWS